MRYRCYTVKQIRTDDLRQHKISDAVITLPPRLVKRSTLILKRTKPGHLNASTHSFHPTGVIQQNHTRASLSLGMLEILGLP